VREEREKLQRQAEEHAEARSKAKGQLEEGWSRDGQDLEEAQHDQTSVGYMIVGGRIVYEELRGRAGTGCGHRGAPVWHPNLDHRMSLSRAPRSSPACPLQEGRLRR
jgi:hypothetical protein